NVMLLLIAYDFTIFIAPGNSTLIPTSKILDFTSKLLSDSQIKLYRNNLRMPQLMLEEIERKYGRFIANNGLIEDPCSFEKEISFINPWSAEEREIFMEKLALYGNDFSKIASFLSHKTTADYIEFYYKSHKSKTFEKVKRSLGWKLLDAWWNITVAALKTIELHLFI
ncbi:hypothetical protein Taro_018976, partial [Colocasia esculenta]|nr:hypothetical protein [Colocasia esculenta]